MDRREDRGAGTVDWKVEAVKAVKGTTQRPDPRREGEDVHIKIPSEGPQEASPAPPPDAPPAVRSFCIRGRDVAQHGFPPMVEDAEATTRAFRRMSGEDHGLVEGQPGDEAQG